MYKLLHETTLNNLTSIIKFKALLKSSIIQELGLKPSQGSINRKLSESPDVSLLDDNFHKKYDEVDGVYFRLLNNNTPIRLHHGGECALIFSQDVLKHKKFVINTEENFGFCIAKDGIISKSQFSGEEGMTITKYENLNFLNKCTFQPYCSEVLIMDNVILRYLDKIFVPKEVREIDLGDFNHKIKILPN